MIPGQGQVFPLSPAASQDAPARDWAATHPRETPHLGTPETCREVTSTIKKTRLTKHVVARAAVAQFLYL